MSALGDDFSLTWSGFTVGSVEACFLISDCYYCHQGVLMLTQLWKLSGACMTETASSLLLCRT